MPLRRPPPNTFIPPSYEESLDSPPSYIQVEVPDIQLLPLELLNSINNIGSSSVPEYSEFDIVTSVEQSTEQQTPHQSSENLDTDSSENYTETTAEVVEEPVSNSLTVSQLNISEVEDTIVSSSEDLSNNSQFLETEIVETVENSITEHSELQQPNHSELHQQDPQLEFLEQTDCNQQEPFSNSEQSEHSVSQSNTQDEPEATSITEELDLCNLQQPLHPAPSPPEPLLISFNDESEPEARHSSNLTNIADLVFLPDPVLESQPQEQHTESEQQENSDIMPILSDNNEVNLLDLDSEPVFVASPVSPHYNLPKTLPQPQDHFAKMQANIRAQLQLEQMQRDMMNFSFGSSNERNGSVTSNSFYTDLPNNRNFLPPTPPSFTNTRLSTATSTSVPSLQDTYRSPSVSSSSGFRTSQISNTASSIHSFLVDSNLNLNLTMPSSLPSSNLERVPSIVEQGSSTTLGQLPSTPEHNVTSMIIDNAPSVRSSDIGRSSSTLTSQFDRQHSMASTQFDRQHSIISSQFDRQHSMASSQFDRSHPVTSFRQDRTHSLAPSQFDRSSSIATSNVEHVPTFSTSASLERATSTTSSSESVVTTPTSPNHNFKHKFKRKPKKHIPEQPVKINEVMFGLQFLKSKYDLGDSVVGKIAYNPTVDKPVRSITFVLLLTEKTMKQSRTVVLDTHVLQTYETPIVNSFAVAGQSYEFDYNMKVPLLVPKPYAQAGGNSDFVLPLQERLPPSTVTPELSITYSVRVIIEHQNPSPSVAQLATYESTTMTSENVGIKISPSYAPSEFDSRMTTRESVFKHIYKSSGTISAKGFLKTTQTFGIAELHVLGLQKFSLLSTEETEVKVSVLFFPEPGIKRVTLPYITKVSAGLEFRTFISPTKRMESYPDASGAHVETIPIYEEAISDSGWTKLPTPPQLSREVLLYGAAHQVPLKELVAHRSELVPSFLSCYGCREYELVVSVSFNPSKTITVRVPLAVVVQNEPKSFLPFAAYD